MRRINITRVARLEGYTIGRLMVDGVGFCDTLELYDGTFFGSDFRLGTMAVPVGVYTLALTIPSPRFGRRLPRITDFGASRNILIHQGNSAADTEGCILVGRNTVKGRLTDSRVTLDRLLAALDHENEARLIIN